MSVVLIQIRSELFCFDNQYKNALALKKVFAFIGSETTFMFTEFSLNSELQWTLDWAYVGNVFSPDCYFPLRHI